MGMMQKLGGRKFLLAVACIFVAIGLELRAPNGLTVQMAGFMTAMVGLFSAANTAAQTGYLKGQADPLTGPMQDKIDDLHDMVKSGMNPDAVQGFTDLLLNINTSLNDVKVAQATTAQAVMSLRR